MVGAYAAAIVNPRTHATTTVSLPSAALGQGGDANPQTVADVVGGVVILESSLSYGMGESGGGPGLVDVYDAGGKRLRQFSLPDRAPMPGPDTPADGRSSRPEATPRTFCTPTRRPPARPGCTRSPRRTACPAPTRWRLPTPTARA